jgi:AAA ATPase domain
MDFKWTDMQINIGQQDGEHNTLINTFNLRPPQMEGNPFVPPQPREKGLFGREDELEKLHELLRDGKNVCVVAGMGGVGKSELVKQYANSPECKANFSGGVFYVDARERQDLVATIVALTQWKFKSELPANLSLKEQIMACWQQWKGHT